MSMPITEGDFAPTELSNSWLFDHIPKLGPQREGDVNESLLPKEGGLPGYRYKIFPVKHLREAQDDSWSKCYGTKIFTIEGHIGRVDCELLMRGEKIYGADQVSNIRSLEVHPDIARETGLNKHTGFPDGDSRFLDGLRAAGLIDGEKPREEITEDAGDNGGVEVQALIAENAALKAKLKRKPKTRRKRRKSAAVSV